MINGDEKKNGIGLPLTIIATAIAGIIVALIMLGGPAPKELTAHVYVQRAVP